MVTPLEMIGARSHMDKVADVYKSRARRAVANFDVNSTRVHGASAS